MPKLRRPGILGVPRAHPGGLPRLSGDEGRLLVPERHARLGHRGGRKGRGQISIWQLRGRRAEAAERRLGRDPAAGWNSDKAVEARSQDSESRIAAGPPSGCGLEVVLSCKGTKEIKSRRGVSI